MKHLTEPVDPHNLVMEWHETYDVPIADVPNTLKYPRWRLRMDLIEEEVKELHEASTSDDIIEMADALGDIVYVVYGMAIEMGINLGAVLIEIQKSNMSKLDQYGMPIYRSDGKVLKGPNFKEPDIEAAIYG